MSVRRAILAVILICASLPGPWPADAAGPLRSTILYQANWWHGTKGWSAAGGSWTTQQGLLTFKGTGQSTFIAPYRVHRSSYAILAEIRLVRYLGTGVYVANSFGILFQAGPAYDRSHKPSALGGGVVEVRSLSGQVFTAAIITNPYHPSTDDSTGNYADFDPAESWHTYRIGVRGSALTLSIDGKQSVDITRHDSSRGAAVGLFSTASRIQVGRFDVIGL